MLGANGYKAYPALPLGYPPNRPFDFYSVFYDMHETRRDAAAQITSTDKLNLDQSYVIEGLLKKISATLEWDIAEGASIPALAPSISAVSLQNDLDILTVSGDFGGTAKNKSIAIGGTSMAATWTDDTITIKPLPRTGPGSGGYILVTMDGAQSNQVLLQQWKGMNLTMVTYNGPNTRTVTCSVNLRASFDTLRSDPDRKPDPDAVTNDNPVVQNGKCQFVATGSQTGSGPIPWLDPYNQKTANPATFATAGGLTQADGNEGGSMSLWLEAAYTGGQLSFDDSSATNSAHLLPVNDTTQNIPTGQAKQYGGTSGTMYLLDTLNWSAGHASSPTDPHRSR